MVLNIIIINVYLGSLYVWWGNRENKRLWRGIKFKDLLIEILNDNVEMEKSKYKSMEEKIIELNRLLEEKRDYEVKRDLRYWEGIEKAYSDKLDEYLDKIVRLEKENFFFKYKIQKP